MSQAEGRKRGKVSYGVLPFVLEEVPGEAKLTGRAGLVTLSELAVAMGVPPAVERSVRIKQRRRGYDEWQMLDSLVLMIAAGGECVEDLSVLGADEGMATLLGHEVPSPSAAKKFLYAFHEDDRDEANRRQRELMPSYVPVESVPLAGLGQVNDHVIRQAQRAETQRTATLDHDGTIIESFKRVAARTYAGTTGYQPSVVVWAEQDLIVADEFRDGNVPAESGVERVVKRAVEALPDDVEQVYYRADSASYHHDLLNWLREEPQGHPRAIFAVSADMSSQLRAAVQAVEHWHTDPDDACRAWGEVDFVPSAPSTKKGRKPDRYLGIRLRPRQRELFADGSDVKHFAVVTNDFARDGLAILNWHRERFGTVEHTHHVLKNELAAGTLPCERFGANAAWFRINVLVYNLLSVLKRTALPKDLEPARPKRLRFVLFHTVGRLIRHAGQVFLRVLDGLAQGVVRLSDVRRRIGQREVLWADTS